MSLVVLGGAILLNSLAIALKPQKVKRSSPWGMPRIHSAITVITVKIRAAGVFSFISVATVLPDYEAGMSVNLLINIKNTGNYGNFNCKIYDNDTESYLVGFGDWLNAGESKVYNTLVGTMPTRDWNLRVEITP